MGIWILDNFGQSMVHRPAGCAYWTLDDAFGELVGMQGDLLVFMVVANGALHNVLLLTDVI